MSIATSKSYFAYIAGLSEGTNHPIKVWTAEMHAAQSDVLEHGGILPTSEFDLDLEFCHSKRYRTIVLILVSSHHVYQNEWRQLQTMYPLQGSGHPWTIFKSI